MKKYTFIAVAFAALAAVSCVKDNMGGAEGVVYDATFSDAVNVKATITVGAEQSLVSWETTDRVGIMYGDSNVEYKADQAGARTMLSPVSASADASEVWAVLPYDASATLAGGVISTTLPAEQPALEGGAFHHLAVAHSTNGTLAFRNVCGLVRVRVTTEGITKVVFAGKASEKVAGDVAITVAAEPAVSTGTSETVALVPASGAASIPTGDYFLAVLPQNFASGFTVTAYKGETAVVTKDVAGPVELKRCGVFAGTIREVTISAISTDFATVGETITVTGTGFSTTPADNVVTIGGKATEVTSASATELKVTVPKGLSRNNDYSVDVTVKGASKVSSPKFRYWYMYNYSVANWLGAYQKNELKAGTGTSACVGSPYFMAVDPNDSDKLWIISAAGAANSSAGVISASISTGVVTIEKQATSSDTGLIKSPFGGAFKPGSKEIYLALKDNKSLSIYKCTDKTLTTPAPETLNNPMDVVFTSNGNYYIADRDNNRIVAVVGGETKVCSLGFKPNSLLVDPQENYMYIGSNAGYGLYRVKISDIDKGANMSLERIAGTGENFSTHTNGSVGQPETATIGNIAGMCFDPTINYLYYFDLKTKIFQVFIPGLGGDWSKGTIKTVIGTDKSSSFCNQGGEIVFANGNFYVAAKGVQKVLKISKQ